MTQPPITQSEKTIYSSVVKEPEEHNVEFDNSSIIVEINDREEEIIDTENSNLSKEKSNDSILDIDHQTNVLNDVLNLKKKYNLHQNRMSIATSGDLTYVDVNQTQNPVDNETENEDISNKSEKNNKSLKRLTDITSVPPLFNNIESNENKNNQEDKEEADITNNEHKITMKEYEDNTCAICLIETKKPTDIENLTTNKDESNKTIVAPTKEDIDNYECKLHCMHKFHYSCIAQWLERSQNCPICRVEIKRYEIEAIEKRFDISIKLKEESEQFVVPQYNTNFFFDHNITEELVRNYMNEHLPWVLFEPYFYTKFFLFFVMLFAIVVTGIVLAIISFITGKLYFTTYVILIVLIIGFIILLYRLIDSIKNNKLMEFMIVQPASSSVYYGLVFIILLLLFANLNNLIGQEKKSLSFEDIYQYSIMIFFALTIFWSCIEVKFGYSMLKEDNIRRTDAEVSRRNQEIMNRNALEREEFEREREEFERNFSHLND
ncbi:hypothetical protein LY90DRAFT_676619 [Neocallimastix californiae]|jgi:hypothetical protein|uniref:RING-type domain-containing protein n=1 Tax=Neocallimastix californiae TaxID=1754190 RepID=A0A1Y2ADT9_9FUNG|nr:hypothetical protein LY90DRAFT_676619 [Neocallimastix californiae]|eukprot:ORY20738.1 hypothetical protein LY90DRAFT_676619 [Neocallimastix californiae]